MKRLDEPAPAVKWLAYSLLAAWTLVVLFPLYWVAITSLKEPIDVSDGPFYLPFIDFAPSLHAWEYIFVGLGRDTARPYLNSVIIAVVATGLATLIGALAAYALARIAYRPSVAAVGLLIAAIVLAVGLAWQAGLDWRLALAVALAVFFVSLRLFAPRLRRPDSARIGNDDLLFWMISQRILPPVVTAVPIYLMFQQLGLLDTHVALIATYATVNLPIVVWLMVDFFRAVPPELEESAQIDGATRFGIFFGIVVPLVKPGLVATTLLVLILCWNEYLLALFLSTANAQTMPLLVSAQNATRGPQWWTMSVLILIMIVPVIVLTLLLQRYITKGIVVGAIKG